VLAQARHTQERDSPAAVNPGGVPPAPGPTHLPAYGQIHSHLPQLSTAEPHVPGGQRICSLAEKRTATS
jgi:hypothetical protein